MSSSGSSSGLESHFIDQPPGDPKYCHHKNPAVSLKIKNLLLRWKMQVKYNFIVDPKKILAYSILLCLAGDRGLNVFTIKTHNPKSN